MREKIKHNSLYRSTLVNAACQLLAVGICTAILFLFVALSYSEITLPAYTTRYAQKDTQQLINLIVAVVAVVIGIWLSHCRRLTNEAETRSELRNEELTIPRLHVHFEAAGGSKTAMGSPALYNRAVWKLVAVYLFAMIMFGFLNSVLSVIFVIESVISDQGEQRGVPIPISVDIPEEWNGKVVDVCTNDGFFAPGCAYSWALTPLSSQLINPAPYTIAGVTFEPPNGTFGLPYHAIKHFSDEVEKSTFDEEHRRYCLPVLDPQLITCHEVPFDQYRSLTNTTNWVEYKALNVSQVEYSGPDNTTETLVSLEGLGTYKIIVNYPSTDRNNIKYRTDDQGKGTFMVVMDPDYTTANLPVNSIVTAHNNRGSGYASDLYEMMYGVKPNLSYLKDIDVDAFYFVARCELSQIKYRDNYLSSWRQVDFTLKNGVSRAHVTEERCPNPRGSSTSGFDDLYYALEGAATVFCSTDGYSKLWNLNHNVGPGSQYFANMSRLDAVVNQIYHIVQTGWSQQSYEYAMLNQTVHDKPVIMTAYPHFYVIRINWTPATYIGLILSVFITLSAWLLAIRWALATYHFGFEAETWNLLRPVDLMAYSLAAWQDLVHDLNTADHRRKTMRGKTQTILHERPVSEGTQSLIGLVESTSTASSPITTFGGKIGSPLAGRGGAGTTVEVTEKTPAEVESGGRRPFEDKSKILSSH